MVEQSILETLIGAVGDGEYGQVIGYVLLAVSAFVRFITEGRFTIAVHRWISTTASLVLGIGTGLAAGGEYWHAVLLGAFAAPTSRGFWELVRGLLPARPSVQKTDD